MQSHVSDNLSSAQCCVKAVRLCYCLARVSFGPIAASLPNSSTLALPEAYRVGVKHVPMYGGTGSTRSNDRESHRDNHVLVEDTQQENQVMIRENIDGIDIDAHAVFGEKVKSKPDIFTPMHKFGSVCMWVDITKIKTPENSVRTLRKESDVVTGLIADFLQGLYGQNEQYISVALLGIDNVAEQDWVKTAGADMQFSRQGA